MHAKSKIDPKCKPKTPNGKAKKPQCTITKLFERQKLKNQNDFMDTAVDCPVCNLRVSQRKINYHLDNECKISEKSPYFCNENLSSTESRPKSSVRRKLSLSLGRKFPSRPTNGVSIEVDEVGTSHVHEDVARHAVLSRNSSERPPHGINTGKYHEQGLPEAEDLASDKPTNYHATNKRLKLSVNASDSKSEHSAMVKLSPKISLAPSLLTPASLSSPPKRAYPLSSQSTPIRGIAKRDHFEDLHTPVKSMNIWPVILSDQLPLSDKKSGSSESSTSPFKSPRVFQSQSPRKTRFIEKIPSCFNDLKLQLSPAKTSLHQERTPKSGRLRPIQLIREEPENDVLAKYFPSPYGKDISNSQESNSGMLFYYLSNFLDILRNVLEVPEDRALFSEEDLQIVRQFYLLPDKCQELFVRLFSRKHHWFRKGKISYPEIADDLDPVLNELIDAGFLESGDNMQDLKTILFLLPSASIKNLCKLLNLKATTQKAEMMEIILEHCFKQNGMFKSFGSTSSIVDIAIKKAKSLLGPCYRLRDEPRRIFVRILMLYSLTDTVEDGMQEDSPAQLTTMLLINMGRYVFPPYRVLRSAHIFRSRDDFLLYEKAVLLEGQILSSLEAKKFVDALDLCNSALDCFNDLIGRENLVRYDLSLPTFLRCYTAGQVFTRCINQRVEVLQKLHNYEDAVVQLHQLLEQDLYCQQYRGHWVERLALNLDQHLQQPQESIDVIRNALVDPRVADSHKLELYQRAERIASAKKHKKIMKNCLKNLTKITVVKVAEIHIEGKIIPKNIPGYKSIFLSNEISSSGNDIDVVACSVEEFALSHYRKNNYPDGMHGEGSSLVSLFGLLFWDVIYSPGIPDAFRSAHQFYPLDLNSSDFYNNRKTAIESRIALLRNSSVEVLNDRVRQCWRSHEGQTSLVNWDMYRSFEFVQSLVVCIGSERLANICERFAKNFRYFRSGVPDLSIWNTETKQWKMVEVKGPGDRLSHKQLFWLDYLHSIGVSVEVCYVKAIGSKKIRKTTLPLDACQENANILSAT